jgi:glycosyltransferase involved in cell wall biosynthesis
MANGAFVPESFRIVVVMPALDEEPSLGLVLGDLALLTCSAHRAGPIDEVIVVDNGSRDRTPDVARAAGATVLHEPRRGYGAACQRALAYLRQRPPEVVVFMDADHSDDATEIPVLLEPILAGRHDLVIGSRTRGTHEPGALLPQARFGNWLATGWVRLRYGFQYTDLGPFRAVRWKALEQLRMADQDWGWTLEMQVRALQEGLRVTEVPVRYRKRVGRSKISGTVLGSARAGRKILTTLWRLRGPGVERGGRNAQ